jgi:hypothetical protein
VANFLFLDIPSTGIWYIDTMVYFVSVILTGLFILIIWAWLTDKKFKETLSDLIDNFRVLLEDPVGNYPYFKFLRRQSASALDPNLILFLTDNNRWSWRVNVTNNSDIFYYVEELHIVTDSGKTIRWDYGMIDLNFNNLHIPIPKHSNVDVGFNIMTDPIIGEKLKSIRAFVLISDGRNKVMYETNEANATYPRVT